jgi:hypothetical protein
MWRHEVIERILVTLDQCSGFGESMFHLFAVRLVRDLLDEDSHEVEERFRLVLHGEILADW